MRTHICLFALVASAGAMLAQEAGTVAHAQVRVAPQERIRHAEEMGFASIIGAEVMPGRPVTGAPYTADTVTEFTQVLADGTRIHNSTSGMMARDSEGRTRRERQIAVMGAAASNEEKFGVVVITDPVAGLSYTLNTREKIATKIPLPKVAGGGKEAFTVTHEEVPGGVSVQLRRTTAHGAGEGKKESLGTKTIEGVQAEGTRTISVIAAGTMGNDRPIEVVGERWFSPQLQTVVLSRHSDPRSGENTFRLINVVRGEPSRTLFEVPPDYTIKAPKVLIEKIKGAKEE